MTKKLKELYVEHTGKVSDKWSLYLSEYDRLFEHYRDKPVRLLEIGIQNGGSLEIWAKYFRNAASLVGCDIDPNCARLSYDDPRIGVVVGDANAPDVRERVFQRSPQFDIIMDDGSHHSSDIIKSFALYFPCMVEGGVFIVEDLHCSYWSQFEGGLFDPYSSISFFKRLADVINHEHWGIPRARAEILRGIFTKYGCDIDAEILSQVHSVEFINSMCVVRKSPSAQNSLGDRVIAGSIEFVVAGHLKLNGGSYQLDPAYGQTNNPWTTRSTPPDEAIQHLDLALTERDGDISNLNQVVAERDGDISNLNQAVTDLYGHITNLDQAIAQREGQIIHIQNSTSWRSTRPLRMMGRQIKRIFKRISRIAGFNTPAVQHSDDNISADQPVPLPASTYKLDSWQPELTRFQRICGSLNLEGRGVEVGPSYNPILPKKEGYSTIVVDHMSADDLRAKYKIWNVDTSAIEEVDVIWKGGAFAEAFDKQDRFDYIVASHVIEHIPDPIRFLQECEKILKPDGKVSLVVPDKRYCFDFYRPLTTTGEWVEAYLQKHTVHPPRKHFDNFAYAVTKGDAIAWGKGANGEIALQGHTLKDAMNHAEKQHLSEEYQDVHGWQFTPESFCMVLRELQDLELVNWSILTSYPTDGFEFYVTLERLSEQTSAALSRADRQALVSTSLNPYAK
ncbi:methyltransferase domain-containing protein [Alphaproteobacteria bacterium]|nr:methyltransferase domain-containing protein [Alphaproteobacteria bacterium]